MQYNRGFSNISLHKLFILDTNSKGARGHIHANWLRPGALEILPNIFFKQGH